MSKTRATMTDSALPLVETFMTRGLCSQAHAASREADSETVPSDLKIEIITRPPILFSTVYLAQ